MISLPSASPGGFRRLSLLPLLLLLSSPGIAAADTIFANPAHYPVGASPRDVVCADVNLDLRPDLLVANEGSGTVSVLLNDGNGLFLPAASYWGGGQLRALAAGRVNADDYPDVIVSNSNLNAVSVLMNNGDGSFADPVDYAVGAAPWGVALGDLNHDGFADAAVVNSGSDSFSVLLNNGDGTLSPGGSYPAGGAYISPYWLATARLNNDDHLDVVVVKTYHNLYFNEGYVEIFFNDGFGGFASMQTIDIGRSATTPIPADLDGDGDMDLAVSGFVGSSYKLSVLLNDGNGVFGAPLAYTAGASGQAAGGDLDCDGDFDVVISEEGVGSYSFSVLLNNGDGSFAYPFTVPAGNDPMGLAAADLDGDCDLDVVAAILSDNAVAVARNTSNPVVAAPDGEQASRGYRLEQNTPNPFAPSTVIRYMVPHATEVNLSVHDVQGRLVRVLVSGRQGPGAQSAVWDGRDANGRRLTAGLYLYTLRSASFTQQRGMTLLR